MSCRQASAPHQAIAANGAHAQTPSAAHRSAQISCRQNHQRAGQEFILKKITLGYLSTPQNLQTGQTRRLIACADSSSTFWLGFRPQVQEPPDPSPKNLVITAKCGEMT